MFRKPFNLILLIGILVSCQPNIAKMAQRLPANDPIDAPYLARDLQNSKIYQYTGVLAIPPIRWIALIVVKHKIKSFLKKLPLKKEIRARVLAKVASPNFNHQIVPFLLGMLDLYSASEEAKEVNFKKHILKYFPDPKQFPGLKHGLFTYEKEEAEEKEKKELNKILIAELITFVDAMLLKDHDFTLGVKPEINIESAERLVPYAHKLLKLVLKEFDIEEKVKVEIEAILKNEHQMEALTISLSEAVSVYLYKHYQMFARRYDRQKKLASWMIRELNNYSKGNDSKLWGYLEDGIKYRRYAVHIVVDGLQGHLAEAISVGDPQNTFIDKIHSEHAAKEKFKPRQVEVSQSNVQQTDFLDYLKGRQRPFDHPNYMPFFKGLYKNNINGISKNGISTTPTISIRNLPMAFTGGRVVGPHGTGLPNFNFLDREINRAYYFWGNDALELDRIAVKEKTLNNYKRLPHLNGLNCNGQFIEGASWSFDPMINLILGELQRDFGDILCLAELRKRVKKEKTAARLRIRLSSYKKRIDIYNRLRLRSLHRGTQRKRDPIPLARSIIQNLAEVENEGLPSYLTYYSPWPDHFAHFKGPFSDEIISPTGEYNRLDYWLGKITKLYKEAGIFDKTLWGMAGDHGLTPVYYLLQPEREIFESLNKEGIKILVKKVSSDEGEGPKLKHPLRPESMKGYDVVVGSTAGGNHNMEFFKSQGKNWREQPTYKDLQELTLLSGRKIAMVDEILNRLADSLDYLVVRDGKCNLNSTRSLVMRKEGQKIRKALVIRQHDRIFYHSETDLLELSKLSQYRKAPSDLGHYQGLLQKCVKTAQVTNLDSWCTQEEWRHLASYTPRPDSVGQIANLYNTDLAGTVNIFPRQGVGFNSKVPGRHAGEHFHEKDAFVGVWGRPISPKNRVISEVNGSMPQVLFEWMKGTRNSQEMDRLYKDGWGFRSFSPKLNFKPP